MIFLKKLADGFFRLCYILIRLNQSITKFTASEVYSFVWVQSSLDPQIYGLEISVFLNGAHCVRLVMKNLRSQKLCSSQPVRLNCNWLAAELASLAVFVCVQLHAVRDKSADIQTETTSKSGTTQPIDYSEFVQLTSRMLFR